MPINITCSYCGVKLRIADGVRNAIACPRCGHEVIGISTAVEEVPASQKPGTASSLEAPAPSQNQVVAETDDNISANHDLPRPWATYAIIILVAAAYLLVAGTSGCLLTQPAQSLVKWGANHGPRTSHGEWWRLLTASFLHHHLGHLAISVWIIWILGSLVERILGCWNTLMLYVLSGAVANAVVLCIEPYALIIGTSGAVFGFIGGLLTHFVVYRSALPPQASRLPQFLFFYIVVDVLCGLSDASFNYVGNLGGLAGGSLLAVILQLPQCAGTPIRRHLASILAAFAGLSLIAIVFHCVSPSIDIAATVTRIMDLEPALQRRMLTLLREVKGDAPALASRLEAEILPIWSAEQQSLERLSNLPPHLQGEVQLLIQYCVVRKACWQCSIDLLRGNQDRLQELEAINRQTDEILRELARPVELRDKSPWRLR